MYQNEYNILKLYLGDFRKKFYLRELSRLSGLPLRTTQRILESLVKRKVIFSKVEGKNKYYSLNLNNIETKFNLLVAEINRTIEFIEKYKIFRNIIKETKGNVLVFGSFASFQAGKGSDLDLLIVGDGKIPDYLIPYELHVIKVSRKKFERIVGEQEPFGIEVLRNHIILSGHSNFMDIFWDCYEKA